MNEEQDLDFDETSEDLKSFEMDLNDWVDKYGKIDIDELYSSIYE